MKSTELIEQLNSMSMESKSINPKSNYIMEMAFREARIKSKILVKEYLIKNGLLVDDELEL